MSSETSFITFHEDGNDYSLINGSMIITYDLASGPYEEGTEGIVSDPDGVAVWALSDANSGIAYNNEALSGFEEIPNEVVNAATIIDNLQIAHFTWDADTDEKLFGPMAPVGKEITVDWGDSETAT